MLFRQFLLPAAIVPAVCAVSVWALGLWLGRSRAGERTSDGERGPGWPLGGLAVAIAFAASLVASTGWPRWPPVEATERLIFLVVLGAVLALGLARVQGRLGAGLRGGLGLLFGITLAALLFESLLRHSWSTGQAVAWLAGLAVAWSALAWALGRGFAGPADDGGPPSGLTRWLAPAVRLALLAVTATCLGLSGSARLALLAGGLTAGVFAIEAAALGLRRRPWRSADAWALAAAVLGLLSIGYFYASLTLLSGLLLLAAFLLLALGSRPVWSWLPALVPLAAALALTVGAFLAKEDDPYDYYSAVPPLSVPELPRHSPALPPNPSA